MNHWLIKLSVNEFICTKINHFLHWNEDGQMKRQSQSISMWFEFECQALNWYSFQIYVRNKDRLQHCTFVTVQLENNFPLLRNLHLKMAPHRLMWILIIVLLMWKHDLGVCRIQIYWYILKPIGNRQKLVQIPLSFLKVSCLMHSGADFLKQLPHIWLHSFLSKSWSTSLSLLLRCPLYSKMLQPLCVTVRMMKLFARHSDCSSVQFNFIHLSSTQSFSWCSLRS